MGLRKRKNKEDTSGISFEQQESPLGITSEISYDEQESPFYITSEISYDEQESPLGITSEFSLDGQESSFDIASLGYKKKKKLPAWAIIPIIAVLGGLIYLISLLANMDGADTGAGIPLQAREVIRGDIQEVFTTYGVVESGNIVTHYSPVSAPVADFYPVVGHYVAIGELMVSFDTTYLESDHTALQLSYQQSVNAAEAALEHNERIINQAEEAHRERVRHVNHLANQVNDLARRINEGEEGLQAQYDALYDEWRRASESLNDTTIEVGLTEEEIENLEIGNDLAKMALLNAQELLELGEEGVSAQRSGVVTFADPLLSNLVHQGMALFAIACTEDLHVTIEIAANEHHRVELGQSVTIHIGSHNYEGRISHINRVATTGSGGTPVVEARVSITEPDEHIRIGVPARVTLNTDEADDVLLIPIEAVNAARDRDYVYIIENGVIQERTIEIGISSGLMIEVRSGLEVGDIVVNDFNVNIVVGARAMPILPEE